MKHGALQNEPFIKKVPCKTSIDIGIFQHAMFDYLITREYITFFSSNLVPQIEQASLVRPGDEAQALLETISCAATVATPSKQIHGNGLVSIVGNTTPRTYPRNETNQKPTPKTATKS